VRQPEPFSPSSTAPSGSPILMSSRLELFRLFLNEKEDPEPFYSRLAERCVAEFPFPLRDRRILDLGAGPGYYTRALSRAGAQVVAVDLDRQVGRLGAERVPALVSDGTRLPFADRSFGGVFCSNMLEHTPCPDRIFDEIERVLEPGGWGWVSWTNWYSPWGGHEIVPFHYLGPHLGYRIWSRIYGEPRKNAPYDGLWPTYIGSVLRDLEHRPALRVLDAVPRYYPSQRWLMKVPGLREVAAWNCLIMFERVAA
jgi:SAM-dependent methyltransferase